MPNLFRRICFGALAGALWLAGCSSGGCGEAPKREKEQKSGPAVGGHPSGSGQVLGFDAGGAGGAQGGRQAGAAPAIVPASPAEVSRAVRGKRPVLLIVFGHDCDDCNLVGPPLENLARDLVGRVDFYRVEATDLGSSGLVPPEAMAPIPGFVLYDGGKIKSKRAGLPFAHVKGSASSPEETPAEYQRRLYMWFREAVIEENLRLNGA